VDRAVLPQFLKKYPHVELDLHFSEQFLDLVDSRIDVAIRIGTLRDSQLVAKKLGDHRRILCASPAYIQAHGEPEGPNDLSAHNCLQFTGFTSFPEWQLSSGRRKETVHAHGSLISNDSPALVEAALAGIGILGVGEWLIADELKCGSLVRVLPEWVFDQESGIYLVRPSRRHTPANVAALCDWITSQFHPTPPWSRPPSLTA